MMKALPVLFLILLSSSGCVRMLAAQYQDDASLQTLRQGADFEQRLRAGDLEALAGELDAALRAQCNFNDALILATALYLAGDLDRLARELDRVPHVLRVTALEICGEAGIYHQAVLRCVILSYLGRHQEAIDTIEQALRDIPRCDPIYRPYYESMLCDFRARAQAANGHFVQTLQDLNRSEEILRSKSVPAYHVQVSRVGFQAWAGQVDAARQEQAAFQRNWQTWFAEWNRSAGALPKITEINGPRLQAAHNAQNAAASLLVALRSGNASEARTAYVRLVGIDPNLSALALYWGLDPRRVRAELVALTGDPSFLGPAGAGGVPQGGANASTPPLQESEMDAEFRAMYPDGMAYDVQYNAGPGWRHAFGVPLDTAESMVAMGRSITRAGREQLNKKLRSYRAEPGLRVRYQDVAQPVP